MKLRTRLVPAFVLLAVVPLSASPALRNARSLELENEAGEAFGVERLEALLVQERASGLEGILGRVEKAVRAHRGGVEAADDASMVVLRIGAGPSPS